MNILETVCSATMGVEVRIANFVLKSIRYLGVALTSPFLIEDSEITLFTNWEHCLFDWLTKSC